MPILLVGELLYCERPCKLQLNLRLALSCAQVLSGQGGVPVTAMSLTKQLLQQEGPRALFSGLGARIAMMGPGAAVSWAVYEETKTWLQAQTW